MSTERTKNARRNIISGFTNKMVSIVMPFVIRTVLIKKLGMDYLGLDNLFVSILQILNLSELGVSSAVVYCMYGPIAEHDVKKVNAYYKLIKKIYLFIGIIILTLGLIIMPFLSYLIKGKIPSNINIYILFLIYLFNTVISYLLFAYKNVILNATQRVDVYNNIMTVSRMLMYVVQIMVLLLYSNYYVYIIFLPLSTIINNIITSRYVDNHYKEYYPSGELCEDEKKELKHQVIGLFIGKLCVVTRNSFDSIIVSTYFGLVVTAIYNNYYYIMNAVVSIMLIVSASIIPGIGNSVAIENMEKNYKDFMKFNFIFSWIVGCCTVLLACLYQPFMILWVGEKSMLSQRSAILFAVYFFVLMIGNIRAAYTEATGLWWENKERAILEAITNLILNIVLGRLFGVNGVIFATILTTLVINFIMSSQIIYKYYFKGKKMTEYFGYSLIWAVTTGVAIVICLWLTDLMKITGVLGILFYGIIGVVISCIVFWIIFHNTNQYIKSKKWIYMVLNINVKNKVQYK